MIETQWELFSDDENFTPLNNGLHPIVQRILYHKGITDPIEMEEYLSPKPRKTYSPFLMKNMETASDIILRHIEQKKNIWIYGDYDVDGIASISLLMDFLSHFTDKLNYYIPLRAEEGYGLNCDAIEEIKTNGGDLIITVDCGSTSVKEVALAKSLDMEIIITDHHNLSEEKPACLILNPKQEDCAYPFKLLSGCGVAFKLTQALQQKLNAPKAFLNDVLDLVALATVADVVPLIDENRTLLKYGLHRMSHTTRPGLNYLIQSIGLGGKKISSYHIGYILGPHFNASGRIDDARAGVELLLAKAPQRIAALTEHLISCNDERKLIQEEGLALCRQRVEAYHRDDLFLVIDSEQTHEGVIGIIAGRIRDLYYRPVLVVTEGEEEGILKGSGRSIDGLDIYEVLKKCEDLFLKFGGHKNACGFSIEKKNLVPLRHRLNEQAEKIIRREPQIFKKTLRAYAALSPREITEDLVTALEKIEPYGMGNEKPYFLLPHIHINPSSDVAFLGKSKEHIKVKKNSQPNQGERPFDILGFGMAELFTHRLGTPQSIDVLGSPGFNDWNGTRSIQFIVSDMKES